MIKNKVSLSARQGFTLIELLVVMAVIGLLAAIALFSIDNIKSKSRDTRRVADVKSIQEGLAMYHNDNQVYPISAGEFIAGDDTMSEALENNGAMNGVPVDPINDLVGAVTYKYYYQSTQDNDYVIEYYLETDSIQGRSLGLNSVGP